MHRLRKLPCSYVVLMLFHVTDAAELNSTKLFCIYSAYAPVMHVRVPVMVHISQLTTTMQAPLDVL